MVDVLEDLRGIDLPFDVDLVAPQCHDCIRKQINKYKKHIDKHGKSTKGRFLVPCTGIPKDLIDPTLRSAVDDETLEEMLATVDISHWAAKYLKLPNGQPWIARWYQENVLRCTSRRKTLRIARRTGKTDAVCIEICYYLFTEPNMKLIVAGPQKTHTEEIINRVRGFISNNSELSSMVVRDVSAPYYEIRLSNGSRVRGFAAGTKGKTEGVGIRGQDADRIYCFPKGTLTSTSEFAVQPIETLTLQHSILGGNENEIQIGDIKNLGVRKGTLITIPTALNTIKCTPDHPLFNGKIDVEAKNATEVIASLYHKDLTFNYDVIWARLLGYLYGDGWISGKSVGFSGQKLDLEQIQTDLTLLGDKKHTVSTRVCKNSARGIIGEGSQFCSNYAYPLFKDYCPSGKKVFQSLRVPEKIMKGKPYIRTAFLSGLFSAEATGIKYQVNKKTLRPICLNMRSTKELWISNWINDICKLLDDSEIKYSTEIKYFKDEDIVDPNDNGDRYVGYITINNAKQNIQRYIDKIGFCYSANKTISINSYKLFKHYKDIWSSQSWQKNRLVRSQEGSSKLISEKLSIPKSTVKYHKHLYDELYSESLLLPHEYIDKIRWKTNYVKLPIQKEGVRYSSELVDVYNLTSGASNRFFAGGLFTHNCEEMDYIDEKAITGAIIPILQTNPDTALIGFSTPSGFKTPFYNLCENNPYYVEFHHNYKVLPHWKNVEMERSSFTEEMWTHEYLAEWGSSESGVYRPSYIDRALNSYHYADHIRGPSWRYCIGVDWNEKHGTEIIVLGYNVATTRFQVVDAIHIQGSEFTQLSGVQAVLDANKKWRPSFIYIDAGAGATNYEILRKTAYEQRYKGGDIDTARLLDRLKRYSSGSSLTIKDPVSSQEQRVPAKPFMINASVRMFEQNRITISSADKILENQLRNYIIVRYTPTKMPVYGLEDEKVKDHRLDALNLAIVAFHLEFDDLHVVRVVTSVGAAINPRTKKSSHDNRNEQQDKAKQHTPDERRIDYEQGRASSMILPARIDSTSGIMKTNRAGWESDKESERRLEFLQRKRSRGKTANNRPSRTTF